MISLFLVEDERIARESIRDNVPWQEHDLSLIHISEPTRP